MYLVQLLPTLCIIFDARYLCKGNFPREFSQVATSQMCNFPSGNFQSLSLPQPVLAMALGVPVYKRKTHKHWTVQTSDSSNVGPVQTLDQYKRQTGTNVGPVQTSEGYIYKEKLQTKEEKIYLNFKMKILVNSQFSLKIIPKFFVKNS